jgi:secreted PhoX family phosphatase
MTSMLTRRGFLQRAAAGVVLVGAGQVLLSAPNAAAAPAVPGYGPLVDGPAGLLALPAGFTCHVVTAAGRTRLESGQPTPGAHDGTGAFRAAAGGTLLVTNHEIGEPLADAEHPVPPLPGLTYDPAMAGGCTVVETDRAGQRLREFVGIAGTAVNCAGGVTPWGTWLTCEETDLSAGEGGAERDHGFVFEVSPTDRAANRDPQPIRALGRFAHEAAAVDPKTGDVYLTEDASGPNGLLYRWAAPQGFRPGTGALRALGPTDGVLAAMRCTDGSGRAVDDLSRAREVGTRYAVEWVPVQDRAARDRPIRRQLPDGDVTRARKLEGAWWGDGGAYVVSSYAREESPVPHDGQVWFLDPAAATLTLCVRFGRREGELDGPDNISVSPWGGLVVAEDGDGEQHLFGATADGATYPIARNASGGEFTGPVYSADGRVLFANVQTPGTMYAITGPWRRMG